MHNRGIVHRDVKPSNVLLADGDRVSVRLLDFGLARMAEEETLTAAGDVPGTLAYISPERLSGKPAGPATDVWSVGVLLWEALAGRHPFGVGPFLEIAKRSVAGAPSLERPRPPKPRSSSSSTARSPSSRRSGRPPRSSPPACAAGRPSRPTASASPAAPPARGSEPDRRPPRPPRCSPAGAGRHLPFFPAHWPAGLAAVAAGLLSARRPRASASPWRSRCPCCRSGTSRSASPILYGALACGWLVLFWTRATGRAALRRRAAARPWARSGCCRSPPCPPGQIVRRATQAAAGVLAAAVAADHRPRAAVVGPAACGLGSDRRQLARRLGALARTLRQPRSGWRRSRSPPPRRRSAPAAGAAPGGRGRSARRSSPLTLLAAPGVPCSRSSPPPGWLPSRSRSSPGQSPHPRFPAVRRISRPRPRLRPVAGS